MEEIGFVSCSTGVGIAVANPRKNCCTRPFAVNGRPAGNIEFADLQRVFGPIRAVQDAKHNRGETR